MVEQNPASVPLNWRPVTSWVEEGTLCRPRHWKKSLVAEGKAPCSVCIPQSEAAGVGLPLPDRINSGRSAFQQRKADYSQKQLLKSTEGARTANSKPLPRGGHPLNMGRGYCFCLFSKTTLTSTGRHTAVGGSPTAVGGGLMTIDGSLIDMGGVSTWRVRLPGTHPAPNQCSGHRSQCLTPKHHSLLQPRNPKHK